MQMGKGSKVGELIVKPGVFLAYLVHLFWGKSGAKKKKRKNKPILRFSNPTKDPPQRLIKGSDFSQKHV